MTHCTTDIPACRPEPHGSAAAQGRARAPSLTSRAGRDECHLVLHRPGTPSASSVQLAAVREAAHQLKGLSFASQGRRDSRPSRLGTASPSTPTDAAFPPSPRLRRDRFQRKRPTLQRDGLSVSICGKSFPPYSASPRLCVRYFFSPNYRNPSFILRDYGALPKPLTFVASCLRVNLPASLHRHAREHRAPARSNLAAVREDASLPAPPPAHPRQFAQALLQLLRQFKKTADLFW